MLKSEAAGDGNGLKPAKARTPNGNADRLSIEMCALGRARCRAASLRRPTTYAYRSLPAGAEGGKEVAHFLLDLRRIADR